MEKLLLAEGMTIKDSMKVMAMVILFLNLISIPFCALGAIFGVLGLEGIGPYIELLGGVVAYIYIIRRLRRRRGYKLELGRMGQPNEYLPTMIFLIGCN
ncbi:hypothetical protein [Halonatronum saccharophilum]|uniref:hypothetical protein n=1 Tax=Halonatronum saccharophilum TaxID=150060 RepID=UPI000487203B|nr:hypothetical protein [Halonatronum saccharophilum]